MSTQYCFLDVTKQRPADMKAIYWNQHFSEHHHLALWAEKQKYVVIYILFQRHRE
jgi:hypothetical protein